MKDSEVKEVIKNTGTSLSASDIDAMNFGEINEYVTLHNVLRMGLT